MELELTSIKRLCNITKLNYGLKIEIIGLAIGDTMGVLLEFCIREKLMQKFCS